MLSMDFDGRVAISLTLIHDRMDAIVQRGKI